MHKDIIPFSARTDFKCHNLTQFPVSNDEKRLHLIKNTSPILTYWINPLSPHDALKHHLTSLITDLILPTTKGFRTKIPMKLVYQYMVIFFNFSLISNHFHSLQVENCDSNPRLVVDEDDYGKLRLERVN